MTRAQRATTSWRAHLWRWRWLLGIVAVVLLIRLNLPWILRRVLVSQASDRLHADVTVGDVDLALYKAGIALSDVAIRLRPPSPGGVHSEGAAQAPPTAAGPRPPEAASDPPGSDTPARAGVPRAPAPTPSATPGAGAPSADNPPILAWKRLALSVHWLPLFRKTIDFREIVLEAPQILLQRLTSGAFNFELLAQAALQPTAEPTPETAPTEAKPGSGWLVGIDRIALSGGRLRFDDRTLKGSEPIDLAIPAIEVRNIALSPEVYGEPSETRVRVMLGQGSVELHARTALSGNHVSLDSQLVVKGLPLRQSRLYIPGVGWSNLEGRLDADLTYKLETDTVNEVRGGVSLHDLTVRVPGLSSNALSLKQLAVRVDPLDLHNHVVNVADVGIDDLWVASRPSSPALFPLLGTGRKDDAHEQRAEAAATAIEPEGENATAGAWNWVIKKVRIAKSGVHLFEGDHALDVHIGGQAGNLAPGAETRAPMDLTLTVGEGDGSVRVAGDARIAPPGFAGDLRIDNLSLPELIDISGAVPENPLKAARLSTNLHIEAGVAGAERPPLAPADVRISGELGCADAQVVSGATNASATAVDLQIKDLSLAGALPRASSPNGSAAALTARNGTLTFSGDLSIRALNATLANLNDLRVTIGSLALKDTEVGALGLLPPPPEQAPAPDAGDVRLKTRFVLEKPRLALGDGKDFLVALHALELGLPEVDAPGVLAPQGTATAKPIRVKASDLKIERPHIRVTRAPAGIILPGAAAPNAAAPATPPTGGPAESSAVAPTAAETSPATPRISIVLNRLGLTKGRVRFKDRSVKPPFDAEFDDITLKGRGLHYPELTATRLQLAVATPAEGNIDLSGARTADSSTVQIEAQDVALTPYNSYVATFSPYRLTSGAVSLSTKVSRSARAYDADNAITLHDLDLDRAATGEGVIERQIGMPVESILALLRDPQGNIHLNVPLKISEKGASASVTTVVSNALRAAIIGALSSPLKLVGAIIGGDNVGSFIPRPIAFRLGRAELTKDGEQTLDGLAALMESRPGVAVELQAEVAEDDARWLREQALFQQWNDEGVFGRLLALGQGDQRARIRAAVADRAPGKPLELSPEDAQALDEWLREIPDTTPAQLEELAAQRLAAAAGALGERQIADTRITQEPVSDEEEAQMPAVKIRLRPLRKQPAASEEEGD